MRLHECGYIHVTALMRMYVTLMLCHDMLSGGGRINEREINYLILFNTLFYYYTLSYSLIPILHY